MSYDVCIRGDKTYTGRASRQPLCEFISALPRMAQGSKTHFTLEDVNGSACMEIDLELVTEQGDNLGLDSSDEINCVRVHVSGPFAEANMPSVQKVCFQIAGHIGWKVFDEQVGKYLDPVMGGERADGSE